MNKFFGNPIVVGILMGLLCIGAAAGMYYGLVQPAQVSLQAQVDRYTPNASYTDPVQGPQLLKTAQAGLASAKQQVAVVQSRWGVIQTTKNPVIDFSDQYKAWMEYNAEAQFDYAQRINAFLTHTGVKTLTFIQPLPVLSDPNQPAATEIFEFPLGSISVFGSYNQISNHLRAWNRFDRIVLIDGLNLSGYNPFLTGTYNATEYIFTNNYDKPGPKLAVGATDALKTNATFESVPEYQVHIANPAPAAGRGGTPGAPQGGFGGPPPSFGGPPPGYRGGPPPGFPGAR